MAIQFHCFLSSFYTPGQKRWLPFAYGSLAVFIILVMLGYVTESVTVIGDKLYPNYSYGVIFLLISLLILTGRNFYAFGKRLRILNNPVIYNQIIILMLGLFVLVIFTFTALLPWGREYPISHFGNLMNAFILTYATIKHQLVDIKVVLRRGMALLSLGLIGATSYWILLNLFHLVFNFELNLTATAVATVAAILVAIFVYRLRNILFAGVSRVLQGESYDHRRQLYDFADKIHNVFSLKEQGGELLALVTRAIGCKRACLLFPETGSGDFVSQVIEPEEKNNSLANFKLGGYNPIVEYLRREQKPLTRENIHILPEFRSLWDREKQEIKSEMIEIFMPLISRDKLIGILVVDRKQPGRYSLEDLNLLEDITNRVAVSMEKEYLREQLREREEELSVINRSSMIMTSSLDIQEIYASFVKELKKVVDVSWAAIIIVEENDLYFQGLFADVKPVWKVGERVPIKDSATEWVVTHKKTLIESDLSKETRFPSGKDHLKQGLRTVAYLPLMVKGEIIGTLAVSSSKPNAYNQRQIMLLEQLASQIAMPVKNSRLYAEVEEKARIDELTGLLNRRSLDEMIASEIGRHSRYGGLFSIIILDIDSFKAFNDSYGHPAGDKLLRQIGSIIKSAIRTADQAFRYGGDEFAILLPQTPISDASQVAERVRKQLVTKVKAGRIKITASLGIASWPADGLGPSEILAAADAALYHCKRKGGNQIHCASGTLLHLGDVEVSLWSDDDTGALSAIYAMAATIDSRDHYTRAHSNLVSKYALAMGETLKLEPLEISRLETCAMLHDIGKIGISNEILNKPSELNTDEWEVIKTHPQLGATIASRCHQLTPCITGILHHHENYDGTGYPKKLKGEEIPLEARILAITDAYAAMIMQRPYSNALSHESALEEIKLGAGKQFDPNLVDVFFSIVKTVTPPSQERIKGGEIA